MRADLEVFPDVSAMAEAAARRFAGLAQESMRSSGRFVVALSGGSTPRSMYARLASRAHVTRVDWSCVDVLWADERCVPPDHPASNYRMAREMLLDQVPIPSVNVNRIRGEDDPSTAAGDYEQLVRDMLHTPVGPPGRGPWSSIDLVLLGLGTDGHTASIFPGSAAAHDTESWVSAVHAPVEPAWRVTLTPRIINAAAHVIFLVSGRNKASILKRIFEGPREPRELPAQLIAPTRGDVRWMVDAEAGAELTADR